MSRSIFFRVNYPNLCRCVRRLSSLYMCFAKTPAGFPFGERDRVLWISRLTTALFCLDEDLDRHRNLHLIPILNDLCAGTRVRASLVISPPCAYTSPCRRNQTLRSQLRSRYTHAGGKSRRGLRRLTSGNLAGSCKSILSRSSLVVYFFVSWRLALMVISHIRASSNMSLLGEPMSER